MGLEVAIERLTHAGYDVKVVGDDKSSELIVDGKAVGSVRDDMVSFY